MLHAMLLNDELQAYFLSGRVRSEVMVAEILSELDDFRLAPHSLERDARLRAELGQEKADLVAGKDWTEHFVEYDEPIETIDGFVYAGLGFVHYGKIDWETGDMICDFIPDRRERPDHLFGELEDVLGTEYTENSVKAEFRGMHLPREKVEMLLPTHRLAASEGPPMSSFLEARRVGRPVKWDWEGALAFIASQAQKPDGLPTGQGAQAQIETMMAEWFEGQTGNSPSVSQIRTRAATVVRMIERPRGEKA